MKKETQKKLTLSKETLRTLEESHLEHAAAGAGPTELSYCKSCVNTTCCATARC